MANPEELDQANREFELLRPGQSQPLTVRMRTAFQIQTVTDGLPNIGGTAYTPPGSMPYQTGPSAAAPFMPAGGSNPSLILNMFSSGGGGSAGPSHPESVPPTGPEEKLRYSCVDGKCIQNPNGDFEGIDECLTSDCDTVGGGSAPDCECPWGPTETCFKAQIQGITCAGTGLTSLALTTYWTYSWIEVLPVGSVMVPRQSSGGSGFGDALNAYELSVADDGENEVPASATITRKRIPDFSLLLLTLDSVGDPWFSFPNPLKVVCT